MLNFLVRVPSPTPHLNFTPPAMIMYGEEEIFHSVQTHPPDFIGLVHVDSSLEYDAAFFGRDYARPLGKWIGEHYVEVARMGGSPVEGQRFGIAILQRRAKGKNK